MPWWNNGSICATGPFMAAELGQKFGLTRAQATLAAYASLYLQEEVQAEALVRQIGDFARFLEVISFSQGSLLNLANLAQEAEIPRKRAESYLGILEDLLISFRLPVFQRRAQRQLDAPEEIDGIALESLVAQHLRALCQLRPGGRRPAQLLAHPIRIGGGFHRVWPQSVSGH